MPDPAVRFALAVATLLLTGPFVSETALAASPKPAAPKPAAAAPAAPAATATTPPAATAANQGTSYGDWRYICPAAVTGGPGCTIMQQLTDNKSGAVVVLWRITRLADGTLVSDWQTPTGILVNRGFTITGAAAKPVAIPYSACTPNNCAAVVNFAPDFVAALAKTDKVSGTIFALNGQGVTFNFSVKGLPDALVALQK